MSTGFTEPPTTSSPSGKVRRVGAGGVRAVLVRQGGHIPALGEVCPHLGGPLADGSIGLPQLEVL